MFIDFYLRKSPAGIKVSACTFTEWGPGWMRTASPQRDEGRITTGKRGGVSDLSEKGITRGWGNLGGPGKWPHPQSLL